MMRAILLGAWVGLLAGCNQSLPNQTAVAVRSDENPPATAPFPYRVGEPIQFRNLTVFPVSTRDPRLQDRYITLDEGLAAKTVEVLEMGAEQLAAEGVPVNEDAAPQAGNPPPVAPDSTDVGEQRPLDPWLEPTAANANQVNSLVVVNRSEKPLYLMPGETITGGSQDRTIGRELVIQPDGKPFPINVFCVESGRWGLRSEAENAQVLAYAYAREIVSDAAPREEELEQAAAEANRGKFVTSLGAVNKDVRLAVQLDQDQSKVWEEVARHNAKASLEVATGAFTANYADEGVIERFQPYVENLLAPVQEASQVVGVIVAINGKVDSLDVFESTPLFTKLWPKLLKSYALDAATRSDEAGADTLCPRRKAHAFLVEATSAEVEETETQDGIALVRRASERVVSFAAGEASADSASGGFGGVHASAFAH